jgi:hypothetical protein
MKKIMMMVAMLAVSFAMQAQTKYHDVEFNEAKGPVKCIKGEGGVIIFTRDGRMSREGMSDAKYDADGYLQSVKIETQGKVSEITYKWENGRVESQKINDIEFKSTYNNDGTLKTLITDAGEQKYGFTYTNYKFDEKGNWISRTCEVMGQTTEDTRTIEYSTASSQSSYNIVGKWFLGETETYIIFNNDGTCIMHIPITKPWTVPGTDIEFLVKSTDYTNKWRLDGNKITVTDHIKQKIILGDNSYYPADIQKQIREYKEQKENEIGGEFRMVFTIESFSPKDMYTKYDDDDCHFIRDTSVMTPQELNQYNKDVADWNKKVKEKEDAQLKAKLAREDLMMAKLKIKALSSGKQYDHWIIGHMYEFGEGNDNAKVTINLDSALVWYKKAANIDPINEEYVAAVKYKMKTGGDYFKHKEQEKEKAAYDTLCKKFGKKYTDDAMAGRITIGMPEALLISAFKTKLVEKTASSKLYRVYGWGMTNLGTTISNNAHTQSVWVRNGKVSNVRNWQ